MANKALIDEYIAMGGNGDVSALSDDELMDLMEELANPGVKPTYIQDLYQDEASKAQYEQATGQPWMPTADVLAQAKEYVVGPAPINPGTLSDEELAAIFETKQVPPGLDVDRLVDEAAMRQHTDARDFITNLTDPETSLWVMQRLGGQAAGGVLNAVDLPAQAAGLYGLASMGTDAIADLLTSSPEDASLEARDEKAAGLSPKRSILPGGTEAIDYANDRFKAAVNTFGVGEPRNFGESAANLTGMLVPIPGVKKLEGPLNLLEYATPFVVGPNKIPRVAANFAVSAGMDQTVREVFDNEDTAYETVFDWAGLPENNDAMGPIAATAVMATAPLWGPAAAHSLRIKANKAPTVKALQDLDQFGPENLYSLTTAKDELKQYILEDGTILLDAAKRAGVPDYDQLRQSIDMDTQMGATVRVNTALADGKLHTPNGDYTAPVSAKQLLQEFNMLPPAMQDDFNRYLVIGDYIDTIQRRKAAGVSKPGDAAELHKLQAYRAGMRQMYPTIGDFSKHTQQATESVRDFLTKGPYAILDAKTKQTLDTTQPHYVPLAMDPIDATDNLLKRIRDSQSAHLFSDELSWLQQRDITKIDINTQSKRYGAVPEIASYTQSALEAQLHNNARGAWIDQMMRSNIQVNGKPLIRKATKKELEDPRFARNVVRLWRNGKEEFYLTESLIAHGLRMDPAYVTNPILAGLYTTRRIFEQATTGVATMTFPAVTGIRDTIAGAVMVPKGVKGPSVPGVIAAPFRILGPKVFKALYNDITARLNTGGLTWYLPGMDQAGQQQLAARLSNAYQNSLYHLSQEAGGFDASMMKERARIAKGTIAEIAKSIPAPVSRLYGRTMGPLLHGLASMIDTLQEAPRFDAFVRNVKQGMSPDDAVREARAITGDTMKGGRWLDIENRPIRGNIVNPEAGVLNNAVGLGIELARSSVPYLNPAIQGMRRMTRAVASDPVRFAQRAWLFMGMPATAAWAWNRMISEESEDGFDYERFATEYRPSRDQVMELYIGVPGLPPEQGISLPIAHEMTPFMAPFQTFLGHMGESGEDMSRAMTHTGLEILSNMGGIGVPPAAAAFLSLGGINPPQSLMDPQSVYDIREDNVGFLNQNVETAIRSMFGQLGAMGVEVGSAYADDLDINDGLDELVASVAKRAPVVKGLGGWRANSSAFTPLSSEQNETLEAFNRFEETWEQYYGHPGLVGEAKNAPPLEFENPDTGAVLDFPFAKVGAEPLARPTNPLYALYGQQIRDAMRKKAPYGFTTTNAQMNVLTKQVHLLRGWNAGRADDFKAWQESLDKAAERMTATQAAADEAQAAYDAIPKGSKTTTPEGIAAKAAADEANQVALAAQFEADTAAWIKENDVDLSNRFDVIRLTNVLEQRRVELMRKRLSIIHEIEDDLTTQLQQAGLMPPGEKFSMRKHLAPMANPVNIPEPQVPVLLGATGPT